MHHVKECLGTDFIRIPLVPRENNFKKKNMANKFKIKERMGHRQGQHKRWTSGMAESSSLVMAQGL